MNLIDMIGTVAGIFTTIAFIPQVIKTWTTRSAGDISLLMFLLFSSGVLLWFIYGLMLHAMPIIIANGITLGLSASILVMKIRDLLAQRRRRLAASQRGL
ncbi:MAG: SemiSWEET transporter [Gammaproteobacteria bacterium]|nr:SemiSWEET transporter [Gammaproteobacteria bacterium]MDH5777997.1 SemiSWEET transporter [Gammaproteobacteria bacterium]